MRGLRARALLGFVGIAAAVGQLSLAPANPPAYTPLVGALHEHSGYSDGDPGATPGSYYASAKTHGLDFMFSGEHSDNLDIPFTFSDKCLGPGVVTCPGGDPDPMRALRKWDAMQTYAQEATTETFTGMRGFEWTSDRFGHINVFFSKNFANAKTDGGYAGTTESFWQWFTLPVELNGGADGLATFNHPNDKKLPMVGDQDPGANWNDFAYVPAADDRMIGIELYNTNDTYDYYYWHALDKGWHVGAIGAEDAHTFADDWGADRWAKTVILSQGRSPEQLREAMLARRFYAVRQRDIRLEFTVDGVMMGGRIARGAGQSLAIHATANRSDLTLDVITSGGRVATSGGTVDEATGTVTFDTNLTASSTDRYYYLRARDAAGRFLAYSSPVWIEAPIPG